MQVNLKVLSLVVLIGLVMTNLVVASEDTTSNFDLRAVAIEFPPVNEVTTGETYTLKMWVDVNNPDLEDGYYYVELYDGKLVGKAKVELKDSSAYRDEVPIKWTAGEVGTHALVLRVYSNKKEKYDNNNNYLIFQIVNKKTEHVSGTHAKTGEKFVLKRGQAVKITDVKDGKGNPYEMTLVKTYNDSVYVEATYSTKKDSAVIKQGETKELIKLNIKLVTVDGAEAEFVANKVSSGGSGGGSGGGKLPNPKPVPEVQKPIMEQQQAKNQQQQATQQQAPAAGGIGVKIAEAIKSIIWGNQKPMTGMASEAVKPKAQSTNILEVIKWIMPW